MYSNSVSRFSKASSQAGEQRNKLSSPKPLRDSEGITIDVPYPKGLSAKEKVYFKKVYLEMRMTNSEPDKFIHPICSLAKDLAFENKIEKDLKSFGGIIYQLTTGQNNTVYREHPLVKVLQSTRNRILTELKLLGLTPNGDSKLSSSEMIDSTGFAKLRQ